MRLAPIVAFLAAAASATSSDLPRRDYDVYDYYALHIKPSRSPADVASYFGLELDGQLGELRDHYLFRKPRHEEDIVKRAVKDHKSKRRRDLSYIKNVLDDVLLHEKQKLRPPHEKRGPLYPHIFPRQHSDFNLETPGEDAVELDPVREAAEAKGKAIAERNSIGDPIFPQQWHLYNPIETGHDLNVSGIWAQGITGKNSTVCIIDDGLDMDSMDIKANYYAEGSYDFNDKVEEPRPRLSDDRHGTRCAGEVAAVKNDVCGVGVAWDAKIAGIRILSKPITDADEAVAMVYGYGKTQIYSCSWGPPDNGMEMGAPGILIKRAMVQAVQHGREGYGTIYVFAAGNGANADDNCNFDGYTNSIYSVTVGAIDRKGLHPYYSEKCSAQLVVTYSSGSGDAIHTTDVGADTCYASHGGTSAAGPLAVGIYALALQVRPDLTWRDIQWLSVNTALPLDQESDWQETPYGKKFSHQFGYGKLDAYQFVEAAKDWKTVKPQAWYFSPWQHVRHTIPEGDQGLKSTFQVTKANLTKTNLERVEHITVTMNVNHTRRGDLMVDLISPSGIVSHLSTARRLDDVVAGYNDWTFMSVAHWGESGIGEWTIIVKDVHENNTHTGTFTDWRLNLWGECIDPMNQELLPMPTPEDDEDHDREDAVVTTASFGSPSITAPLQDNPTDHPDRPINHKTTMTSEALTTTPPSAPSSTRPFEEAVVASDIASSTSSSTSIPTATGKPKLDSFLPSYFPTFGVTKKTQIWIYGATGLIVIFCLSLAVYFWTAKRKAARALARENYEFEMIDDEEDGTKGSGKKSKRRAGELYDAFAGESDEEVFSDLDEEERYTDEKAALNKDPRRSSESQNGRKR